MRKEIIRSENCFLSELEYEDLEPIRKWRNQQTNVLRQKKLLTKEDQKKYWNHIQTNKSQRLFSIISPENKLLGYCGLTNIHEDHSRAELSFLLDTSIQEGSQKYSEIFYEVLKMLCKYGFEELKLNRLFSETYEFRKKHISVIEKAGFTKEGELESHVYIDGKYHNSLLHSIIINEYKEVTREKKNIKAIIFDFDDTLVDETHWLTSRWQKTINFAQRQLGLKGFGETFWEVFNEKGPKYKHHVDETLTRLNKSHDFIVPIVKDFLYQKTDEKLLDGAKECLVQLKKKYVLCIITDGEKNIQLSRIKNAGIYSYFDAIICTPNNPKPHPKPYRDCLKLIGVSVKEAIYISHDIEKDLKGAKAVGMGAILLGSKKHPSIDYNIASLSDLKKIFMEEN